MGSILHFVQKLCTQWKISERLRAMIIIIIIIINNNYYYLLLLILLSIIINYYYYYKKHQNGKMMKPTIKPLTRHQFFVLLYLQKFKPILAIHPLQKD